MPPARPNGRVGSSLARTAALRIPRVELEKDGDKPGTPPAPTSPFLSLPPRGGVEKSVLAFLGREATKPVSDGPRWHGLSAAPPPRKAEDGLSRLPREGGVTERRPCPRTQLPAHAAVGEFKKSLAGAGLVPPRPESNDASNTAGDTPGTRPPAGTCCSPVPSSYYPFLSRRIASSKSISPRSSRPMVSAVVVGFAGSELGLASSLGTFFSPVKPSVSRKPASRDFTVG